MKNTKSKINCFYRCGATNLTAKNIEQHYQKYHSKLKTYLTPEFTCDNCYQHYQGAMLYSPTKNRAELAVKPHYCPACVKSFQSLPKSPLKPKKMKKSIKKTKSKLKPKKALKSLKSTKKAFPTSALALKSTCPSHTPDYYHCLVHQTHQGLKGKKITQACSECKSSAPALLVQRKKEVTKLVKAYQQLGASLSKLI